MASSDLFVVGIGASAGGLEPMVELLKLASCHKSMCFVVVSHVPRETKNALPRILGAASKLTAHEITDGMKLQHCGLYTIPPGMLVRLVDCKLRLSPRPEGKPNESANVFFESLAAANGVNAIGVILSGAAVGRDGERGIRAIKDAGGYTFAQDPHTAAFPAMPEIAIGTGCVDSVLPPERIGQELSVISWVAATEKPSA